MGSRAKEELMERDRLVETMQSIVGSEGVISEREELRSYECDGLMNYRVIPELVVLPETAEQVQRIVKLCSRAGPCRWRPGYSSYSVGCAGSSTWTSRTSGSSSSRAS
jgi:FAD/FMN-containing dehydrogenase